jgi:hypothetical protein
VSVASKRLRDLQLLGCRAVQELRVDAPALESLTLYGHVCWSEPDQTWQEANPVFFDFVGDMPALRDAYLSHLGCGDYNVVHDMAYPCLYYVVAHARNLSFAPSACWYRFLPHKHGTIRAGLDSEKFGKMLLKKFRCYLTINVQSWSN